MRWPSHANLRSTSGKTKALIRDLCEDMTNRMESTLEEVMKFELQGTGDFRNLVLLITVTATAKDIQFRKNMDAHDYLAENTIRTRHHELCLSTVGFEDGCKR